MQYWTTSQTPLRQFPLEKSAKLCDIPKFTVVDTPDVIDLTPDIFGDWEQINYITATKTFTGWCYKGYLEEYHEHLPGNVAVIDCQTPNPHDAAQYMIWKKNVQFNMCGEICVAMIVDAPLTEVLSVWERERLSIFRRVFRAGRAGGTGPGDLESVLAIYERDTQSLTKVLMDPVLKRALATPRRMKNLFSLGAPIVGVRISSSTGDLQRSGVSHWVVLTDVAPDGINRGWVEIFNPFQNRHQEYTWSEFSASMGAPYGLLVLK